MPTNSLDLTFCASDNDAMAFTGKLGPASSGGRRENYLDGDSGADDHYDNDDYENEQRETRELLVEGLAEGRRVLMRILQQLDKQETLWRTKLASSRCYERPKQKRTEKQAQPQPQAQQPTHHNESARSPETRTESSKRREDPGQRQYVPELSVVHLSSNSRAKPKHIPASSGARHSVATISALNDGAVACTQAQKICSAPNSPTYANASPTKRHRNAAGNPECSPTSPPPAKRRRTGPKSIFENPETALTCLLWLENDPALTVGQLEEKFKQHNIRISNVSITRFLRSTNVTWKRDLPIPTSWNAPETINLRRTYVDQLEAFGRDRPIVFVGATCFQLFTACENSPGALQGEKPALTVVPRVNRLECIAAIDRFSGELHESCQFVVRQRTQTHEDVHEMTANRISTFLLDLAANLQPGSVFVVDPMLIRSSSLLSNKRASLSLRDSGGVKHLLKTIYDIDMHYLAPHSPFLNPIEHIFDLAKQSTLPSDLSSLKQLLPIVQAHFVGSATTERIGNAFDLCERYYLQARASLPFTGPILCPDLVQPTNIQPVRALN